jgi:protein-tyrosine-phosphatase
MLRDLLARRGNEGCAWRIESAGVWAQEGLPVLKAVNQVGLDYGLDLANHRARSVAAIGVEQFDLILAMERKHAATLANEFPELRSRIMTLGEAVSGYEFEIVDPPRHAPRAIRATAKELAGILAWGFDGLRQRLEASARLRQVGVM